MRDDELTETEETAPEVIADEPAAFGRKKALVFGAIAAVLLAAGGGGWILFGEEEQVVDDSGPSPEEQAAHDRRFGRVDGIDYAKELDIEMPDDDVAGFKETKGDGEEGAAAPDPGHMGKIFSLEPFVVNISDGDRDRYLKLKADLELSGEDVSTELNQRLPQIRDLVISMLGGKSFEDIRTIEGKNFLREEILLRINSLLVTGKAKRVFFTEFVVQ